MKYIVVNMLTLEIEERIGDPNLELDYEAVEPIVVYPVTTKNTYCFDALAWCAPLQTVVIDTTTGKHQDGLGYSFWRKGHGWENVFHDEVMYINVRKLAAKTPRYLIKPKED